MDDSVSSDSGQRRVLTFLEKGHTWMEVDSVHLQLKANSGDARYFGQPRALM